MLLAWGGGAPSCFLELDNFGKLGTGKINTVGYVQFSLS